MELYDGIHDGEPQPSAARLTGPGLIHPVEPIKNVDLILLRNADAGIPNHDLHPIGSSSSGYRYQTALRGIFDAVVYQVFHGGLHQVRVTIGRNTAFLPCKLDVALLGNTAESFCLHT